MKVEWPREYSLTSGQVFHHRLSWKLRCPELHEGKGSWPDLWITQQQSAAEHAAASWPCRTPGATPEPQTLTSTQEAGAEHTLSKLAGDQKGGEQGKEGSHREWQHWHKHKHTKINTRVGPNQTSSGPGQECKAVPPGPSKGCRKGPRHWGRTWRGQEPREGVIPAWLDPGKATLHISGVQEPEGPRRVQPWVPQGHHPQGEAEGNRPVFSGTQDAGTF